jgi:hypothetical protein
MGLDRLGRRRAEGQERGLRSLHPILPEEWLSRPVRIAMSEGDWERFERLVDREARVAATRARAYGRAVVRLLDAAEQDPWGAHLGDWQDWERRKVARLLPALRAVR